MSSNISAEKCNCTVSFLVVATLVQSVAETAPLDVHCFMEGVAGVVYDGKWRFGHVQYQSGKQ